MGKGELTPEERFLKEGEQSSQVSPVDVHDTVMAAIGLGKIHPAADPAPALMEGNTSDLMIMHRAGEAAGSGKAGKQLTRRRPVRGWAALLALVLLVLVGGGYSLYYGDSGQAAEFQYEVLPFEPLPATEDGAKIDLSVAPLTPGPDVPQPPVSEEDELLNLKYSEAYEAVDKLLQPGEFASFVLKQEGNGERYRIGVVSPVMIYKDYSGYLADARKYTAPELSQPLQLPEGYAFDEAWIRPVFKSVDEQELFALTGGFELAGGFRVTWRQEPLANINFDHATLVYKQGENQVRINARRIADKTGTAETLMWTRTTIVENIEVGGQRLIYLEPSDNEDFKIGYKYRLVWANPQERMIYDVTAGPENVNLTKDELIRIAAGLMH